jgi:hypothetical protein
MRQDGIADIKRLKAFNYNPDGSKSDINLIPGDKHYILRFVADKEWITCGHSRYGIVILCKTPDGNKRGLDPNLRMSPIAGAFHQMAKIICPAESDSEYRSQVVHGNPRDCPGRSWFSVGSDAEMQVFYEGSPLASADIKAVSKKEGKEMALVKTDSLGRASHSHKHGRRMDVFSPACGPIQEG